MNSKYLILCALASALVVGCKPDNLEAGKTPSGNDRYRIVYALDTETDEGASVAIEVRNAIASATGSSLKLSSESEGPEALEVIVGNVGLEASDEWYSTSHDVFDYSVYKSGNKLVVAGGGGWALSEAASALGKALESSKDLDNVSLTGNVYGKRIFGYEGEANIRVFDWNVWNNGAGTSIPASWKEAWEALGKDPTIKGRLRGWSGCMLAYSPDVIGLQEFVSSIEAELLPVMKEAGYAVVDNYAASSAQNHTPILYNPGTMSVEKSFFAVLPASISGLEGSFNNENSKTYTIALMRHIPTGQRLVVANAHLWWKAESEQAGSDQARLVQIQIIKEVIDGILATDDVPVILMGDLNAKMSKPCIQYLLSSGYSPAWEVANLYGDGSHGRHHADYDGFSRIPNGTAADDGSTAIDHMMVANASNLRVETFQRITPYFTMALSDHYPNCMDALVTERIIEAPKPSLNFSVARINADYSDTSAKFDVQSNVEWSLSSDNPEIVISPVSGSGNGSVTITFPSNASQSQKTSTISAIQTNPAEGESPVKAALSLVQNAAPAPKLDISVSEINVDAAAVSAEFAISSNLEWTISCSNTAFCASPSSGSGDAVVQLSFPANTLKEEVRTEIIVSAAAVDPRTVTLVQAAMPDEPEVPSGGEDSFNFLGKGLASGAQVDEAVGEKGWFNITFSHGKNPCAYYPSFDEVRIYYCSGEKQGGFTISANDGRKIAAIELTNVAAYDDKGKEIKDIDLFAATGNLDKTRIESQGGVNTTEWYLYRWTPAAGESAPESVKFYVDPAKTAGQKRITNFKVIFAD